MASSKEGNLEKQSSAHAWQEAWRTSLGNNQEAHAQRSLGARVRTISNKIAVINTCRSSNVIIVSQP